MIGHFLYRTDGPLGMLSSAETIDVIAETMQAHKVPVIVLDPVCSMSYFQAFILSSNKHQQVMVSTSGSQLLPEKAVKELRTKLLPLTTILTPNIPEALLLLKDAGAETPEPKDLEGMVELAKKICSLGPKAVLLKGGHLPLTKDHKTSQVPKDGTLVVDILFDGVTATLFETEFLVSKNTHGTGCSLASAIAANLASGKDMIRAVRSAVRFVEVGIKTSIDLGKGSGPINHFHSTYTMPFAPYVTQTWIFGISLF
jgi:hydroxymethylpyrimidine kinase/phosphomethylpyrimidine kinase